MPADKIGDAAPYTQPLPLSASKLSSALHSILGSSPQSPAESNASSSSSSSSILSSPPPAYHDVYPPSSPSTAPTSPSDTSSISSKSSFGRITNKWQTSLTSPLPVKPLLTARTSDDRITVVDIQAPCVKDNVLARLFPASSPIHDLSSTAVDLSDVVPSWQGAVLDNASSGLRTLYVMSTSSIANDVNLRDAVCGVLEKAEDEFGANGVVIALDKKAADLGELVHQLCYVGGTITNQPVPRTVIVVVASLWAPQRALVVSDPQLQPLVRHDSSTVAHPAQASVSTMQDWVSHATAAIVDDGGGAERLPAASSTASSIASAAASAARRHLDHYIPYETATTSPSMLALLIDVVDVKLPANLSLLPAMFRTIAFLCVLPVIALTVGDIVGWAIFKLVLRPLGYASTVRYKDPEPTTKVSSSASTVGSGVRNKPRSRAVDNLKASDSGGGAAATGHGRKRPSSLPAPLRRVRDSSPDLNAFELDTSALKQGDGSSRDGFRSGADDDSASSTAPSPVLSYESLSRSPSASPSNSPRSPMLVLPMSPSTSSTLPNAQSRSSRPRRQRSLSETSTGSSVSAGLQRFRAPSVGWEGPLLGGEDGLLSPARSDDEALAAFGELKPLSSEQQPANTGDDDFEAPDDSNGNDLANGLRKRKQRVAGAPKRGPKFDFTSMG
ncbi:hypothetical protein OIV83_001270 [Microbotryomycetes sp. JL201]|nr:hypothetical protein OIV83_001270 [Microbotryomycetes sp. JL201]